MSMTKKWYLISLLAATFVPQYVTAMVFDNRRIPLFRPPQLIIDESRSEFAMKFFMTTAKESLDQHQNSIPLGQLFGKFDQVQLADGIAAFGNPNPLPSEFQGLLSKIPWEVNGKRQAQGFAFAWHQSIINWLSTGFSWLFMRVDSRHEFKLDITDLEVSLKPGDEVLLGDNRRELFSMVGIREGNTAQLGFGDIDWYLRVGNRWEYSYRFRRIDVGFRLGALMATGVNREPARPASIPFGGNGHWGVYAAFDGMFELKEDWKTGFLLRVNKRFEKVQNLRVPVKKEPSIFGATVAPIEVDPGYTMIFSPYVLFENLRQGLALGLNFTLVWHTKDSYEDRRADKTVPLQLEAVRNNSEWSSEYFTLNILYDFGKMKVKREFNPIVTFRWDVPSTLFIANRIDKAQRVSIGIDFVY